MGVMSNIKYISGTKAPHITDINLDGATAKPEKVFANMR